MQSVGISRQQASKDINSYITDCAPKNLEYDKYLKGYVPMSLNVLAYNLKRVMKIIGTEGLL